MSAVRGALRADLQRNHVNLDKLGDRAVIVDAYGDAWQKSQYLDTWYRAFDGDGVSSFELAQNSAGMRVMDSGSSATTPHVEHHDEHGSTDSSSGG
ncbi:hypothetical protein O1W71_02225 [Microbacterium sp. H37-C3]|uniref:hypothetical protein n=1 Tax=Microbacterium sp. H37-C3 TaxID=3004354 RepID=UPI0022AFFED0|nr:hypothetical protein [Microbacterium sp. H37-C3]MCZ4066485.1 hypothetical protein [Microbacterium sp. H37-C3]